MVEFCSSASTSGNQREAAADARRHAGHGIDRLRARQPPAWGWVEQDPRPGTRPPVMRCHVCWYRAPPPSVAWWPGRCGGLVDVRAGHPVRPAILWNDNLGRGQRTAGQTWSGCRPSPGNALNTDGSQVAPAARRHEARSLSGALTLLFPKGPRPLPTRRALRDRPLHASGSSLTTSSRNAGQANYWSGTTSTRALPEVLVASDIAGSLTAAAEATGLPAGLSTVTVAVTARWNPSPSA